jgi:hypothetical protein
MTVFEYEIQGKLPCCIMPIGKKFDLLGCNFTYLGHIKTGDVPSIHIQTKIDAKDSNEAERMGYEMCKDAAYLLEICIGDRVYFDMEEETCSRSNNANAFDRKSDSLPIYTLEEIAKSKIFLNLSKSKDASIQNESVKRSIHWYNGACREANKIDAFLKLWIAFEILSGKKCQALGKIRSEIIHLGRQPANIEEKCIRLNQLVSKAINGHFIVADENRIDESNQNLIQLNKVNEEKGKESRTVFEVSIPGELDCDWPKDVKVDLDGCSFSEGGSSRNFLARTEVQANNQDEAMLNARQKCDDAANILEFLIGRCVILSSSNITIKRKGESHALGICSLGCNACISGDITNKELHALENVRSALDKETASEKKSLAISIRWRARALREHESEIDRFLRLWIALEVLVEGEGQKLVDKVTFKLKGLYPKVDEQKIKRIVGPIYGMRGDIVHKGIHRPQDLNQELVRLGCIYDDLLKEKLSIESSHSSAEHFVKFNES